MWVLNTCHKRFRQLVSSVVHIAVFIRQAGELSVVHHTATPCRQCYTCTWNIQGNYKRTWLNKYETHSPLCVPLIASVRTIEIIGLCFETFFATNMWDVHRIFRITWALHSLDSMLGGWETTRILLNTNNTFSYWQYISELKIHVWTDTTQTIGTASWYSTDQNLTIFQKL